MIDRIREGWFSSGMIIAVIGGILSLLIIFSGNSGFLSFGNAPIAAFTCMGITLVASFWSILSKNQKEKKKRKKEAQEQEHLINITCPAIIQKLQSTGFSSLNQVEKSHLCKLSDQMGNNLENLHENEVKVLEVAFSNQGVYNMLQMRSNQLQPNNQAALKHLKTIKYATMASGLNAARELGEDMGEGFSE